MKEVWKNIEDYPNYEISSLGNVRNRSTGRILKTNTDGNGYHLLNLYNVNSAKTHYPHRLVAKYFLNHKDNSDKVIDHKDNDRNNNQVSNLQIISNRLNTSKDIDKTKTSSKYTGVYWYDQRKKWKAVAKIKGKITYIGLFNTEIEAHKAYQDKISKL